MEPLRNGYTRKPRGGSSKWQIGVAGAILRNEFFGAASGTLYFAEVASSLAVSGTVRRRSDVTLTAVTYTDISDYTSYIKGQVYKISQRRLGAESILTSTISRLAKFYRDVSALVSAGAAETRVAAHRVETIMAAAAQTLRGSMQAVTALSSAEAAVRRVSTQTVLAGVLQGADIRRDVQRGAQAAVSSTADLGQANIVTLISDGTSSNSGWTAVGAGTLQDALATGDSDYIRSASSGSVAVVTLSNPSTGLTLTASTLIVRARLG